MLFTAIGCNGDPRVIIGLQNEPYTLTADAWWTAAQAAVNELRALGITNYISVSGAGYANANLWPQVNGPRAAAFVDSADRTYFETHIYFDQWGSGTQRPCWPGSANRVDPAIHHAAANGYQLIFGELAFSDDPSCDAERAAATAKLLASTSVYGATFWTMGNFYLYP